MWFSVISSSTRFSRLVLATSLIHFSCNSFMLEVNVAFSLFEASSLFSRLSTLDSSLRISSRALVEFVLLIDRLLDSDNISPNVLKLAGYVQ